ncbi:SGNH hydrolase-type esterase domain-containing protein [Aspergillus pseudoustus]|uniref:SGNH hydrolase-type esterase domain-containing protein n=1 Tax=Aspergillus pseudoustus TaxID=1810923 RepID=A0ABR4JB75_9EURO
MKFTALTILTTLVAHTFGSPTPRASSDKPPYIITIGDSTVAVNGGWGDGFLSYLHEPADGTNRGKSGSTTVSWRANGRWAALVENINSTVADYDTIVTMQFGHNDQKALTLDEYRANIVQLCADIKALGATPIIITPLTRRNFDGDSVQEDFVEWRGKAIAAAKDAGAKWLDLTIASTDYINAIGEQNAATYDLSEGDGTHLNSAGEIVFGRMVADLLIEKRPDLEEFITPNEALSEKIWAGEYATGDE